MGKASKLAFYAVRGGSTPGVYCTWEEAVRNGAQGVHGVRQKKFGDRASAEAFVTGASQLAPSAPAAPSAPVAFVPLAQPRPFSTQPAKTNAFSALMSGRGATGGKGGVAAGEVAIFTDGACQGNNNVATSACPAGWGFVVVEECLGDPPAGGHAVGREAQSEGRGL